MNRNNSKNKSFAEIKQTTIQMLNSNFHLGGKASPPAGGHIRQTSHGGQLINHPGTHTHSFVVTGVTPVGFSNTLHSLAAESKETCLEGNDEIHGIGGNEYQQMHSRISNNNPISAASMNEIAPGKVVPTPKNNN